MMHHRLHQHRYIALGLLLGLCSVIALVSVRVNAEETLTIAELPIDEVTTHEASEPTPPPTSDEVDPLLDTEAVTPPGDEADPTNEPEPADTPEPTPEEVLTPLENTPPETPTSAITEDIDGIISTPPLHTPSSEPTEGEAPTPTTPDETDTTPTPSAPPDIEPEHPTTLNTPPPADNTVSDTETSNDYVITDIKDCLTPAYREAFTHPGACIQEWRQQQQ